MSSAIATARGKLLAWTVATKGILGVMYLSVTAEGARLLLPFLGMKLSKFPGLAALARFQETHRLDVAHCFALALLVATFFLWVKLLSDWLGMRSDENGLDRDRCGFLVRTLAFVIIGADAYMFLRAVTEMSWSGGGISLIAILATAAWTAVLIFSAFVTVILKTDLKQKESRS